MTQRYLRVLVLTTTFPARPGDGTPEFVLTLGTALANNHDVHVLAPRMRGTKRREVFDGVTVHRFAYFPRRWERLAENAILPGLRAQPWRIVEAICLFGSLGISALIALWAIRPDVIHAHWIIPGGVVARVLHELSHVPYVLTVHGADAYALNGRALSSLKRFALRKASTVVPVSQEIAVRIDLTNPQVVPMGVDVESIRSATEPLEPRAGQLLFVGRLAEKKGVDILLRSLVDLEEAKLRIVGDGPDAAALRALATNLKLEDRVEFLGAQPKSEVLREMKYASAVVIPSRTARDGDQDGTPVVLAEAMAAGVPVIVSELGGLAEHVTDGVTGMTARPGSTDSLTDAIRRTIDDPETAASIATAASERMHGPLSITWTADQYERIFRTAVTSR